MQTKIIQKLCLFCFTLFLSLGFSINYVTAQLSPFYWEFINVDIAVQTNGDMLVTETQKYIFTGEYKNQRYRYIPLNKVDQITEVSVSENDQLLPSKTKIENNQLWILWEHQLKPPESHTFVLKYRVIGGLHINGNEAQVYWKALFRDRQAPVKQAKVTVKLPEPFAAGIKNFKSYGTSTTIHQVDAKTIEFVSQAAIEAQNELEVQVTFNHAGNNLKTSQWQNSQFWSAGFAWIFLILFIFSFVLFCRTNTSSISSGSRRRSSSSSSYSNNSFFGGSGFSDGGGGGG